MPNSVFLFIAVFLLLLPIGEINSVGFLHSLNTFALVSILIFGIPHGAIDNVLFIKDANVSNTKFIVLYILTIVINVVFWVLLPTIAFLFFILLSAYHFGESQLSHYFDKSQRQRYIIFMTWGLTILVGMLAIKYPDIVTILDKVDGFKYLSYYPSKSSLYVIAISNLALTVLGLIYITFNKQIRRTSLVFELFMIILIGFSFYLFPLLVAFALYFVILHSFKVMKDEYSFLLKARIIRNISSFIKLLLPFTLLSLFGLIGFCIAIYFDILIIAYEQVIIIFISSITLPHAIVMQRFYLQN